MTTEKVADLEKKLIGLEQVSVIDTATTEKVASLEKKLTDLEGKGASAAGHKALSFAEALKNGKNKELLAKEIKSAVQVSESKNTFFEDVGRKSRSIFIPSVEFLPREARFEASAASNTAKAPTQLVAADLLGPIFYKELLERQVSANLASAAKLPESPLNAIEFLNVFRGPKPALSVVFQSKLLKDSAIRLLRANVKGGPVPCAEGRLRPRPFSSNYNTAASILATTLQTLKNLKKIRAYSQVPGWADGKNAPTIGVSVKLEAGPFLPHRYILVSDLVNLKKGSDGHNFEETIKSVLLQLGISEEATGEAFIKAKPVIENLVTKYAKPRPGPKQVEKTRGKKK